MVFGLSKNPEKYEAKAITYEQKGKTNKAIKYREKAARLRANQGNQSNFGTAAINSTAIPVGSTAYTQRTPAMYETRATKWEQRGNFQKAQKNREKVWRLQNPQYMNTAAAPSFYSNNKFVGYNVPFNGGAPLSGHTTYNAPTVETHVHPTIVQQTSRPEKIVEVQPVVHREIDAPQVRVIEKHLYETVPSTGPGMITKQAIVEETVRPHIIEEVQPVIHREVPAPFVERVEQHVTEHLVRPTTTTKEVLTDNNVRQAGVAAGGVPLVQQTTTTTTTTATGGAQGQGRRL